MPRVPTYAKPRIRQAPIADTSASPSAPSSAFGVAKQSPIAGAIDVLAPIVEREAQRINQFKVTEADNRLTAEMARIQREAEEKFKGADALKATAWAEEQALAARSQIEADLNGAQKPAFLARADERWTRLHDGLERRGQAELNKHADLEDEAFATNARNEAIANPNEAEVLIHRGAEAIQRTAERNGIGPEKTAQLIDQYRSGTQMSVIRQLATLPDGDIIAEEYAKGIRTQLVGGDLTTVDQIIAATQVEQGGLRGGADIWGRMKPATEHEPILIADMMAEADRLYEKDPKMRARVKDVIREKARDYDTQVTAQFNARKASVLGSLEQGASWSQIAQSPDFLTLPGNERETLRRYYRSVTRESTVQQREDQRLEWDAAMWDIDPAKLPTMTRDEITNLLPEIGRANVNSLLRAKAEYDQNMATVRTPTLDTDLFKQMANDYGFAVTGMGRTVKLSKPEAAALARLRTMAESAISARQVELGRKLEYSEQQQVMSQVLGREVMRPTVLGNGKSVHAAMIDPGDTEAFVPMAQIRQDPVALQGVNALVGLMRRERLIPLNATDAAARMRYSSVLERAYAAAIRTGRADSPEVLNILREAKQ